MAARACAVVAYAKWTRANMTQMERDTQDHLAAIYQQMWKDHYASHPLPDAGPVDYIGGNGTPFFERTNY